MKVGICLPQFSDDPERAIDTARKAEAAGIDGVFVFDHLWPLGQPERPALHSTTLLGALAVETRDVTIGPFVARVGLVPDAVLVHTLVTLHRMAGERFVAALGTGDRHNRDENVAYGVPFLSRQQRLDKLAECLRRLRAEGVTTWAGGDSAEIRAVAAAEADGWNGWGLGADLLAAGAAEVARLAGQPLVVSWGGQVLIGATPAAARQKLERHGSRPGLVHGTVAELRAHFDAVAEAGASWVVCAPLDVGSAPDEAIESLATAANAVR